MTNKFILGLCFLIPVSFLPVLGQKPELSSLIEPFVERDALAGAVVVVADKDEELTAQSFGFSDRKSERKMSIDSIFWIASQSKPMTAVAVMTLVDQGKISLDDPVEKYLPEFRSQLVVAEKKGEQVILEPPVHPITIREVLSHMSGLPFKSSLKSCAIFHV
ncbi:MAG: serine hydrolase [Verrucomicrobia bacterium]|nr:serine hydrolase [Verrucomicrobiota bacterium]MDA1047823.1 serine hydrolase [Verrucomicrobiota bacterium]